MKRILFALTVIVFVSSLYFAQSLLAGDEEVKVFTGKIIEVAPVLLKHPPRYAFCRIQVVSDSGEKSGFFVPRATTITDLNGKDISGKKYPGKGERVEIKYYTLKPGVDDRTYTVSIRYVPLDYVQQSTAPVMPAQTVQSTTAPTSGLSFQLGDAIPADKAVVYIYRPAGSGAGGQAIPFGVKAGDKVVTTLSQGGYCAYSTEPGQIEFTTFEIGFGAPSSTSSITVDAKSGQVYYLKGSHGKGLGGRAHLESVSPEAGASEIANCRLVMANPGLTLAPVSASVSESKPSGSSGPIFKETQTQSDKAVVYVYHSGGSNYPFMLRANGRNITLLRKGQYYAYAIEPGTIEFTAQAKLACSIALDTKVGQAYYLKGSVPSGFALTPSLVLVSPEVGANEIANCKAITTP